MAIQTEKHPDSVSLRLSRIIYVLVWIAAAVFALLCEADVLPVGFIPGDSQTGYALHTLCIFLTLGCTWGALRLFTIGVVRRRIQREGGVLIRWNVVRTLLLAVAIAANLVVYYGLMNSSTPLYCLFITLVGFVFCWPKNNEV